MEDTAARDKNEWPWPAKLAVVFTVLAFASPLLVYGLAGDAAGRGVAGDWLGGSMTGLASLAAFFLMYAAFMLQRRELGLQRDELRLQREEMKLLRKLWGKQVRITHGLAETLEQLEKESDEFKKQIMEFIHGLVSHYLLDDGKLVIAHAGMKESMQGRGSGKVREFGYFGETTGEKDLWQVDLSAPTAVIVGSEATGIDDETLRGVDEILQIPTRGFIPSYNVQAAVSMILGEWLRQDSIRLD